MKPKELALFDFDGTITTKDTLFLFLRYCKGDFFFISRIIMLGPVFMLYVMRIISNSKAKELVLTRFLKGMPSKDFQQKTNSFVSHELPKVIRQGALDAIGNHLKSGIQVAVVTASVENWVKPWCDLQGIRCIATQLEVRNETLSGKFSGNNCYGDEKVHRIKEAFKLEDYSGIYAYGDSVGDLPMLSLANHQFYKPFRI